jgi:hypothetical protein
MLAAQSVDTQPDLLSLPSPSPSLGDWPDSDGASVLCAGTLDDIPVGAEDGCRTGNRASEGSGRLRQPAKLTFAGSSR